MIKIMRINEFASHGVNEMAVKGSALAQYDEVDRFSDDYLKVKKGDKYNLIDFDGNLIGDLWFDDITPKKDGTFDVSFTDTLPPTAKWRTGNIFQTKNKFYN